MGGLRGCWGLEVVFSLFHWSKCTIECAIRLTLILKSAQARCEISYLNLKAVLVPPKTAGSAQTHRSISFIWIVWSTLYVYLWLQVYLILTQSTKNPQTMKHWKPIHFILIIVTYIITLSIMTNFRIEVKKLVLHVYLILTQSKQNFKHWNTKGMKKIFMLENTIFFQKWIKAQSCVTILSSQTAIQSAPWFLKIKALIN